MWDWKPQTEPELITTEAEETRYCKNTWNKTHPTVKYTIKTEFTHMKEQRRDGEAAESQQET